MQNVFILRFTEQSLPSFSLEGPPLSTFTCYLIYPKFPKEGSATTWLGNRVPWATRIRTELTGQMLCEQTYLLLKTTGKARSRRRTFQSNMFFLYDLAIYKILALSIHFITPFEKDFTRWHKIPLEVKIFYHGSAPCLYKLPFSSFLLEIGSFRNHLFTIFRSHWRLYWKQKVLLRRHFQPILPAQHGGRSTDSRFTPISLFPFFTKQG